MAWRPKPIKQMRGGAVAHHLRAGVGSVVKVLSSSLGRGRHLTQCTWGVPEMKSQLVLAGSFGDGVEAKALVEGTAKQNGIDATHVLL